MTDHNHNALVEAVARAMCSAVGVDPDSLTDAIETFDGATSQYPHWHKWKLAAEQHIAASNAIWQFTVDNPPFGMR